MASPGGSTPNSPSPLFATPSTESESPLDYFRGIKYSHRESGDTGLPHTPVCSCCPSLVDIVSLDKLIEMTATISPSPKPAQFLNVQQSRNRRPQLVNISMVYNEYGELVPLRDIDKPVNAAELNVKDILRVLKKAYHHDIRTRIGDIISEENIGKTYSTVNSKLRGLLNCTWVFDPMIPKSANTSPCSQPRVLELGCGGGRWSLQVKKENPTWLVNGVDDTSHWLCVQKDRVFRDFMDTNSAGKRGDYFYKTQSSQPNPEFNVRNLNTLLDHARPIPENSCSFVRGRDVFDRVESYAQFLNAVRLILQSDGVVEFLELDPRPRTGHGDATKAADPDHTSGTTTGWTNKIEDRFKVDEDCELAKTAPGWSGRVAARLAAQLRPIDGVPAANLKEWMIGAGFHDVEETIRRLPVGGPTRSGKMMQKLVLLQIEMENSIPKLKAELPSPELDEIQSGKYFFNIHFITGRKPPYPRLGDLLSDGTRQEMTCSMYDAMARNKDTRHIRWKRSDTENNYSEHEGMVESSATIPAKIVEAGEWLTNEPPLR